MRVAPKRDSMRPLWERSGSMKLADETWRMFCLCARGGWLRAERTAVVRFRVWYFAAAKGWEGSEGSHESGREAARDAMNATSLYVSTCRLVLQADAEDPNSWTDLYRLVPYLRQSLSCTVCSNLLIEPHTPTETNCQHHVCRSCRGGRKKLKPSCGWCKDYDKYIENVQLRILLQCYKKLCEYLTSTGIYRTLLLTVTSANNATTNGAPPTIDATVNLMEIIQEGAGFKDEFKSNAGLSKSAYSILPCVYTSTTSTQTQANNIQTNEAISQNIPGMYNKNYSLETYYY